METLCLGQVDKPCQGLVDTLHRGLAYVLHRDLVGMCSCGRRIRKPTSQFVYYLKRGKGLEQGGKGLL